MWLKVFAGLSISQLALIGLMFQSNSAVDWLQILEQYPPLAIVLIVVYYLQRIQREDTQERRKQQLEDAKEIREWLEKMLEIQRGSLKETYHEQYQFLNVLLTQIESKQNGMSDRIELLTQQMAVNTNTVSEIAKVDSIVSELIARLENK